MKKIKLSGIIGKGKYTLVDDKDFDFLNQWTWHLLKGGYIVRTKIIGKRINGKQQTKCIYMHRLIMNTPIDKQVDHINHNKLDNTRENLRNVSITQNQQNRLLSKNNTSGYTGVVLHRSWRIYKNKLYESFKWRALIVVNKKTIMLGSFKSIQAAWLARRWGERLYYGL